MLVDNADSTNWLAHLIVLIALLSDQRLFVAHGFLHLARSFSRRNIARHGIRVRTL